MKLIGCAALFYQESDNHAKMTYSRIDLFKRGPSFTQFKQICNMYVAKPLQEIRALRHDPSKWASAMQSHALKRHAAN